MEELMSHFVTEENLPEGESSVWPTRRSGAVLIGTSGQPEVPMDGKKQVNPTKVT
jgi:hypothetical protein